MLIIFLTRLPSHLHTHFLSSGAARAPFSLPCTAGLHIQRRNILKPEPFSLATPTFLLILSSLGPLQQTCILPTSLFGAVRRLSFSPDGSMLCGIGADRDNSLCVWSSASGDWTDGARVALGQGPRRAAMFVAWSTTAENQPLPYQVLPCSITQRCNDWSPHVKGSAYNGVCREIQSTQYTERRIFLCPRP